MVSIDHPLATTRNKRCQRKTTVSQLERDAVTLPSSKWMMNLLNVSTDSSKLYCSTMSTPRRQHFHPEYLRTVKLGQTLRSRYNTGTHTMQRDTGSSVLPNRQQEVLLPTVPHWHIYTGHTFTPQAQIGLTSWWSVVQCAAACDYQTPAWMRGAICRMHVRWPICNTQIVWFGKVMSCASYHSNPWWGLSVTIYFTFLLQF